MFEPLPVVVKAVETAEDGPASITTRAPWTGQQRYSAPARSSGWPGILRLGPDAGAAAIIDAAGRHLGRTPEEIGSVLNAAPRAEAELVRWAQQLDRLEKEVHTR